MILNHSSKNRFPSMCIRLEKRANGVVTWNWQRWPKHTVSKYTFYMEMGEWIRLSQVRIPERPAMKRRSFGWDITATALDWASITIRYRKLLEANCQRIRHLNTEWA